MTRNHGFTRISYTNPIFILVKHIRVNPSNPRHPRSIYNKKCDSHLFPDSGYNLVL